MMRMRVAALALAWLVLNACGSPEMEKKPLYYVNPMDPTVRSDVPMQDSMGMDYIPVYEESESDAGSEVTPASGGQILYYVNPMDPTVRSDVPMKDSMGMDYVPVYEESESDAGSEVTPASGGQILYYVNPMDPTVRSDVPMKDSMGMDYVPVYAEESASETPDSATAVAIKERTVRLSPSQEEKIGVAVETVERRAVPKTIRTWGRVNFDEKRTAVVSARFPGRIEKLSVNFTGRMVKPGEPLLLIYSPSLISAQQELLQADRSRQSSGESPVTIRLWESARGKLRLWGLADSQIQAILDRGSPVTELAIPSPIEGTVVRLNVAAGEYVDEGTVLYQLSDLRKVWIEAEIFEKDLENLGPDARVQATALAYPDRIFEEAVSFVSPSLDPETRTVRIRAEMDNASGLLKPGMFLNILVTSGMGEPVLVLPEASLLDTGLRKLVYVRTAPGRYAARDVVVGSRMGGFYPVVSGVGEGEEVVTEANFLIDSESRLKGVVE